MSLIETPPSGFLFRFLTWGDTVRVVRLGLLYYFFFVYFCGCCGFKQKSIIYVMAKLLSLSLCFFIILFCFCGQAFVQRTEFDGIGNWACVWHWFGKGLCYKPYKRGFSLVQLCDSTFAGNALKLALKLTQGADHLTRIMAGYVDAFPRRLYKFGWIIAVLAHAAIKPKAHSCQLDN